MRIEGRLLKVLNMKNAHEFALYVENFSSLLASVHDGTLTIADESLAHRMQHVLRAEVGESCVLFDRQQYAQCTVQGYLKRAAVMRVESVHATEKLSPEIIFLLPVLKKEAFETALYSLVESGATFIQPVITQKIHRQWITAKDMDRLQRIMIAAAEQAKQYHFAQLLEPQKLVDVLQQSYAGASIFFEPHGTPLLDVAHAVRDQKPSSLRLLIGPEADLTDDEKALVASVGFTVCALTPTILRASSAAALAQGIFRSIF